MPFDYPEEEQDDVEASTQQVPAWRTVSDGDPSSAAFPTANDVNDAQFQRRFGAPVQTATKPSIGQRILALGQRGSFSNTDASGIPAVPRSIGERIVAMGRQPIDSPAPGLTAIPGISSSRSTFGQSAGQDGLFSDFIPLGADGSANLAGGFGRNNSAVLFASAEAGQRSSKPAGGQQGSAAPRVGPASVPPPGVQQQQNQDRAIVNTTSEQDDEHDLSPNVLAPIKVKPPQDMRTGDWSGGEAAPGQPIVKSEYHIDYLGRGKRKIGGDRSWRNNNPGNIKYSTTSPACKDAIGQDYGDFAVFDSMQDGIRAQDTLWRTPRYQNMTLQQAVKSWTSGDPPSKQESYVQDLMTQTHAGRDTKVSAFNESQLQHLQEAQRKHEGGQKGRIVDIYKPKSIGKGK